MNRKITVNEEIGLEGGGVASRQSFVEFDEDTGELIRPDARLDVAAHAEWNRIVDLFKAEGLEHCLSGSGLLDHCVAVSAGLPCRKRGSS